MDTAHQVNELRAQPDGMAMQQYHDLMRHVLERGTDKKDRTGTGTRSVFGYQMRFDLSRGFPLLTTKKLHWKSIVHELLWFLKGETNVRYLNEHDVGIWDPWCPEDGDLGPLYGVQWRKWPGPTGPIDQIARVIDEIKVRSGLAPPDRQRLECRRNLGRWRCLRAIACSSFTRRWAPFLPALPETADIFIGVPFNIASYALLTQMMAQVTGLKVGEFVHSFGDAHLYLDSYRSGRRPADSAAPRAAASCDQKRGHEH